MTPGYLSLRALASYSGLSTRTLRRYLTHSFAPLPHYRVQQKILVSPAEFDTWLRQFKQSGEDVSRIVDKALSDMCLDMVATGQ